MYVIWNMATPYYFFVSALFSASLFIYDSTYKEKVLRVV